MNIKIIISIGIMIFSVSTMANTLKDYKNKKHEKRERVNSSTCEPAYITDCQSKCADEGCRQACQGQAKSFCEERERKRTRAIVEVGAKAATLGAGALGVIFDDPMAKVGPNGTVPISPYSIIWDRDSLVLEIGGGSLEAGAKAAAGSFQYRTGWFGFGGYVAHLFDESGYITESDIGPMAFFGSRKFIFGLQPSLVTSQANGFTTENGPGLRTHTIWIFKEKTYVVFAPMLYWLNELFGYHARLGLTYRFTPSIYLNLSYEYRDVVDINDLQITSASLQGGFLYFGYRLN